MHERARIEGSARQLTRRSRHAGAVDPASRVTIMLLLRTPPGAPPLRETAERVVRDRRPLTHEEYFARYRASADDVARVLAFAARFSLANAGVDERRRTVTLEGSAADVERAFGVALAGRAVGERAYRAHGEDASVPSELGSIVQWIFGLNDVPHAPHGRSRTEAGATDAASHATNEPRPRPAPDPRARPIQEPPWTSYPPPDYARMYDFPAELTGKGACIGVLELYGGFLQADMDAYFAAMGMAVPDIVVVGDNEQATGGDAWANFEVTLDVQVASACAPGARCAVYFSGATGFEDTTAWTYFDVITAALFDEKNRPDVLTMSWGLPEGLPDVWTLPEAEVIDQLFVIAAILGITVCMPSGDSGSVYPITWGMFNAPSLVYFPGSSPWVLCVGGTTAEVEGGRIVREVVWNRLAHNMQLIYGDAVSLCNLGSSGGGVSHFFLRPDWQKEAGVPEATLYDFDAWTFSNPRSFAGRGCPDVAANTDFLVGYKIYVQGGWRYGGGTSASTPFTAALLTRIREGVGRRLGFLNPLFYELQLGQGREVFHSVDQGNNAGYVAEPGARWNPCTGLGAIRGRALLAAIQRAFL